MEQQELTRDELVSISIILSRRETTLYGNESRAVCAIVDKIQRILNPPPEVCEDNDGLPPRMAARLR